MSKVKPETLEDFIKSMEGLDTKYGEPLDLIWRMARILDRELDGLYGQIQDLRGEIGL